MKQNKITKNETQPCSRVTSQVGHVARFVEFRIGRLKASEEEGEGEEEEEGRGGEEGG